MSSVRRATADDAPAMGRVHVLAWQAAYRGQMPDAYLDGLSAGDRARMWSSALAEDDRARALLVAEGDTGVVGFVVVGPALDGDEVGELYAINVDPERWGTGVGRALLRAAEAELSTLGYTEAVLWVLPSNERARRFYESAGWHPDGSERTAEVLGVEVLEIRYRRRLTLATR